MVDLQELYDKINSILNSPTTNLSTTDRDTLIEMKTIVRNVINNKIKKSEGTTVGLIDLFKKLVGIKHP